MKKNGQFPNVRVEYGFGAVWTGKVVTAKSNPPFRALISAELARNHGMVTRLAAPIFQFFFIVRVLSDVPAQSAGDLVDGLSKAEEEVFSNITTVATKSISRFWTDHAKGLREALFKFTFQAFGHCP